jgi:hypothetical protein
VSYPQPQADSYAINKYGFFRLNTLLSSPGDIYESPQSGHAFCVGPESDIANINMAYFDDQVDTFIQFATVSPTRSLVGLINARNEAKYSPSSRPGRILCWANDIYDPSFRPQGFAGNDTIEFVAPRLDMIQYLHQLPSVVPPRPDKAHQFQNYNVGLVGNPTFYLVVPYYGRKYCYIQFTNRNQGTANTFGIKGINYTITQNNLTPAYTPETVIRAPAAVAPNTSVTEIITPANRGVFDAILFSLTDSGPAPLRIVMSDMAAGV